jgi:hypothetical protein
VKATGVTSSFSANLLIMEEVYHPCLKMHGRKESQPRTAALLTFISSCVVK